MIDVRAGVAWGMLALAAPAWAQSTGGAGPAQAAPLPGPATLAEAVRLALEWQPEMRALAAQRRIAAGELDEARSGYRPSVDLSLGRGRERSNNVSTRPGDLTLNRSESELSLSQLLFDTGAVSSQVRRSEARSEGAALQVAAGAESVAQRVAQAYLEVMRLSELLRTGEENVAAHRRTLQQVTALAVGGVGRMADVQQVSGRLAQAQAALAQLTGQLEQASADFRHLVGRPPGALAAPAQAFPKLERGLDALVEAAVDGHPGVRAAARDHEAALADREFARSRLGPRVSLDLGMTHGRDLDGVRGINADATAMVRLRQNLFRGGADDARIRQAEARIDEASARLGRVRNDVERELRIAYENYRTERARLAALEEHARASEAVVEAYAAQFRLGQRSLIDLLNADAERFSARGNLVTGRHAALAAGYRALAGLGVLLDALGLAPATGAAGDAP